MSALVTSKHIASTSGTLDSAVSTGDVIIILAKGVGQGHATASDGQGSYAEQSFVADANSAFITLTCLSRTATSAYTPTITLGAGTGSFFDVLVIRGLASATKHASGIFAADASPATIASTTITKVCTLILGWADISGADIWSSWNQGGIAGTVINTLGHSAAEVMASAYQLAIATGSYTPGANLSSTNSRDVALGTFFEEAAAGSIAFDVAANSGDQASANTYSGSASWNGSNRFLAVDVSMLGPGVTVTSMTYGGAACTFIGSRATVTSLGSVECWGIKQSDAGAPAAGANTLVVNLSGTLEFTVEWASYTGVDQTTPTEAFNSAQATNVGAADATVSITTVADNDWVHGAVVASDTSITAVQTSRNNVSGTIGSGANEDNNVAKTPAGTVTMSYTAVGAGVTWAIAGYGIRPFVASTASTPWAHRFSRMLSGPMIH